MTRTHTLPFLQSSTHPPARATTHRPRRIDLRTLRRRSPTTPPPCSWGEANASREPHFNAYKNCFRIGSRRLACWSICSLSTSSPIDRAVAVGDRSIDRSKARPASRAPRELGKMVQGTLEVLLVGAKGLENTDYLCNMDPYAVLKCRSQEQKSSVASGKGSDPEWNETFMFSVTHNAKELIIKLMDSDSGTDDDFVGEATISLEAIYTEGSIPPTVYNVVKDEEYRGEIKVGLTFTPEDDRDRGLSEEDIGGWR